ncbi:MAG: hypothetical protein DRQ88_09380 [Epsilonproteobacteria bacterium]|nr:MAG: hypothetical protein DRQ88_09380 [Campylobacterota bacterium]
MIKGFPSSDKLLKGKGITANYATLTPVGSKRHALDVVPMEVSIFATGETAEAGSSGSIIVDSGHSVREGDMIRFLSPASIAGVESSVLEVIDANSFKISMVMAIDIVGAQYEILRFSTTASGGGAAVSTDLSIKQALLLDYSVTSVDDTAWVPVGVTTSATKKIHIFDSGGYPLSLGVDGVEVAIIPPGGFDYIDLVIAAGVTLQVKSIEIKSISSGMITVNLVG